MQLQQLYYFKETAERGSINKAAEALLMTQPNLSRSLQKLEEELGLKLFSRDNKGIQLTEEGQQLYQHTCGVLERLEIIKRMSREEIPRMLSVSAFPTLTSTRMLQELYKWYREKSIQFTFRERRLSEIVQKWVSSTSIPFSKARSTACCAISSWNFIRWIPISGTSTWGLIVPFMSGKRYP